MIQIKISVINIMPVRMTMNLANPNTYPVSMAPVQAPLPRTRPIALNAPMIDRVHRAKPGCGACGKKVA